MWPWKVTLSPTLYGWKLGSQGGGLPLGVGVGVGVTVGLGVGVMVGFGVGVGVGPPVLPPLNCLNILTKSRLPCERPLHMSEAVVLPAQPPLSRATSQNESSPRCCCCTKESTCCAFCSERISPCESFCPIITVKPIIDQSWLVESEGKICFNWLKKPLAALMASCPIMLSGEP